MAITAGGVGSGLDVEGIVSQLMYLERQPIRNLESKNKELEARLSSFGKLKSALSSFQSAMAELKTLDKFKIFSATSSDEDVLNVSADSSAASGIYNINVTRLAQNHKLGSEAISSVDTFSGSLLLSVNGNTLEVDTSGLTLSGIRDKINSDVDNPGITATIINTATGVQRLVLTSEESGTENAITVDETNVSNTSSGPVSSALGLSILNKDPLGAAISIAELDAEFTIDGIDPPIYSSSNSVTSVIDGISLELKNVGSSVLNLDIDKDSIKDSVQGFVDAYNDLWGTFDSLASGDLSGDSSIRSLRDSIRNIFITPTAGLSGSFNALIDIGINTDAKTGRLSLNTSTLSDAVNNDLNSLAELFANDGQGFAYRLEQAAESLSASNGFLDSREETLRYQIRYNEDQTQSLEARMELREKAMRAKFAQLDSLIGSMQSTSAFLANNLY